VGLMQRIGQLGAPEGRPDYVAVTVVPPEGTARQGALASSDGDPPRGQAAIINGVDSEAADRDLLRRAEVVRDASEDLAGRGGSQGPAGSQGGADDREARAVDTSSGKTGLVLPSPPEAEPFVLSPDRADVAVAGHGQATANDNAFNLGAEPEGQIIVSGELPSVLASSESTADHDFSLPKQDPSVLKPIDVPERGRPLPVFKLEVAPLEPTAPDPTASKPAALQVDARKAPTEPIVTESIRDVFTRRLETNPFIDTDDDRVSTFGLDVDTASFSLVRSYLNRGVLPPADLVRVEGMVNALDSDLPDPGENDFAISIDGAPSPFAGAAAEDGGGRYRLVRIGVRARDLLDAPRRPSRLTFVVDTSGSMRKGDRLELVKSSLRLLLDQLGPEDRVALVEYNHAARTVVESTADFDKVREALQWLRAGGSTNAEKGLTLGYLSAQGHFLDGGNNRVIFCSDGVANTGVLGPEALLRLLRASNREGIELLAVGVGLGNYNDVLLEMLANGADGRYAYVDTVAEAERLFVGELSAVLETVAEEAKVQVEWDPKAVERYRLLGYESRDIADVDFRNDSVDAGEIGAGHSVTALYEIKLARGWTAPRRLGTVRLRYRAAGDPGLTELEAAIERRRLARRWSSSSPRFRLVASVAEFAEILRGSFWSRDGSLAEVEEELEAIRDEGPRPQELDDVLDLVRKARALKQETGTAKDGR
ncbi:MAG: von Willebrand factor type A domain-containing protein, partial [Acidobacteriota bacterium]